MLFDYKTKYDADELGHFGSYGGRYAPEMLMPALEELEEAFSRARNDRRFVNDFSNLLKNFAGRPTPLYFAENLTREIGGARIYLKNEGLNHTGAHKITHCLGQALLAKKMGKNRLIAETGAGQHGVAAATVAAKFGFECVVYMGEVDVQRQRPNVFWMQQLGAEVVPVKFGSKTLKDAVNAALKDWITNVKDTHYLLGSTVGPHPFPTINCLFQSVVGYEVKQQMEEREGKLPDCLIACVGGGSNAMGLFYRFLENDKVRLIGVEAGGKLKRKEQQANRKNNRKIVSGKKYNHAARFQDGEVGVVEGYKSFFLQDKWGNIGTTHSISAGLDYAGIGPQLAYLRDKGRVGFTHATDEEVVDAFKLLARTEGILPALESAHALAEAVKLAMRLSEDKIIVVNVSGRADKDIFIIAEALKDKEWETFIKEKANDGQK